MKLFKHILLTISSGFLFLSISAQEKPYHFETFPPEIALSHSSIKSVLQDYQGFLWLGTWSGLMKYDGYEVKLYKQEFGSPNGLESNKILTLFEDSQKRLWIGTGNSGFYLYDREQDRFIPFKKDPDNMNSLSNNNVWAIFEDSYGFFWIGTENGLNLFKPEKRHFKHLNHVPADVRSLSSDFVYSICEAPDRSLWIGTTEGLNRLIRNEKGEPDYFIRYSLAPAGVQKSSDHYSSHNYIYKIKNVGNEPQNMWIGTKEGLKKIRYSNKDLRSLDMLTFHHKADDPTTISHNQVEDMWESGLEDLWVATLNGLNKMDRKSGHFKRFVSAGEHPNLLTNNSIKALFYDRSGVLWIGTEGGVQKLNLSSKPFITIRPDITQNSSNHVITTIENASDGSGLWLGTRGSGLNYLPLSGKENIPVTPRHYPLATPFGSDMAGFISDLVVDDEGWIWITTLGAGLVKIKESELLKEGPAEKKLQQYSINGDLKKIGDEHLMSVAKSLTGDIWVGSWNAGIARYNREDNNFISYKTTSDFAINLEAYPNVHLREKVENGQSFLWAGTRGGGLLKLKFDPARDVLHLEAHYQYLPDQPGVLSNNAINCIFFDSRDRLWVGTDNGLNLFHSETNTFSHYFEKDGLPTSTIQSIQEDDKGRLWVSTQIGIFRFEEKDSEPGFSIKNFDVYDGLQDNFFYDDASCVTRYGQLIFGGIKGLNFFDPEKIESDTIPPKVLITDFRLFNKSIPIGKAKDGNLFLSKNITETDSINLNYKNNIISFEFAGIHFGEPKKIKYAYMLEGFDEEWVYTDASQRIAHYTNLPYKDFTFKVKAANSDGFWSEPVAIQITVNPPFWLTGWAFVFYALIFTALLFGMVKVARMRTEFNHKLQLERLERDKMDEVNQMKLRFFTNISHELRTPLTLIISPLEQFIKEKKTDKSLYRAFTRMHYNANQLLTMISQLLDIRKSEAGLMKLKVAEGNVVNFVREVIFSFSGLAKQRNIDLSFHCKDEDILLWFDHDQMEKVLFNLMSNALKFTPEKGKISVHIVQSKAKDTVRISIKDNGNGIPESQLEQIFLRFYQVEKNQEANRKGGTGIGLTLAKSIIEAHHGKIWAESQEGKGATFFVELLPGETHFTEEEKVYEFLDGEQISNYVLPTDLDQAVETAQASAPAGSLPAADKPKLLIIEDNPDIRSYLRENLEAKYSIHEASDGVEGLNKAQNKLPDLILADISMPRMDGIEMCGKIKSDINTSHIPVILLTARTSLIFKIDGLETGADDYITKPFNMHLLATRIKNLIDSRQNLKKKFSKNFDFSPSSPILNSLDEQLLSQIKIVVEKHIDDSDFSVEQLASSLHLSRMQLYRKLKSLTGQSPNKIIREIRLKRAVQLLKTGQYNISDVTYMVGYNDLKSFREQFKKKFGVSPSEYDGE